MTIAEKIKRINKIPSTSQLKTLKNDSAIDISTFWEKVVEPLLPDYDVMKKWHKLLIDYISLDDAVFMIRKGNEESKQYMESVPADALRRGFLTKTNAGYEFTYNDNDFATYMLAMVLDGDIIDTLNANDLKLYLKTPNATIRFNKSGKGGVEKERAFFKINGTPPRISSSGYTVAHIFDVNNHYYDDELGFKNAGGEEALKSPYVNIDKGRYSHYIFQGNISGKDIYYRNNYHPGVNARKFLEAHMLRFLHPLNYFCAPKDNNNGYVYCEFTDHIKNRRFKRISGYEHLLYYAHYKFKEKYCDIYEDFLKRIMLPANSLDFFENSVPTPDYYGSEKIDIQYGNPLSVTSSTTSNVKLSVSKKTASTSKRGNNEFHDFEVYAAKNGVATPSYYSALIRSIMKVLNINSIDDLEDNINVMIDVCTQKIDDAKKVKDKSTAKKYSDRRSALRKYRDYLKQKHNVIGNVDTFLKALEDSMRKAGDLSDGSIKIYLRKLSDLLENGYTIEQIYTEIDDIIKAYSKDGQCYDPNDHGNTKCALDQVAKMIKHPYIRYKKGWSSFVPVDEHVTGYCIDNDTITISYGVGFIGGKKVYKKISDKDMKELIEILDIARNNTLFEKSNTHIITEHGSISSYDYQYRDKSGVNCRRMFIDNKMSEVLQTRYSNLINRYI